LPREVSTRKTRRVTGRTLTVGVVQMTSAEDVDAALDAAEAGVEQAAAAGARFVALPDAAPFLGAERRKFAVADPIPEGLEIVGAGPIVRRLASISSRFGVVLAAGTLPERSDDPSRVYNTSLVFGPDGQILARYRKIHLFDVGDVGDGFGYTESKTVAPGDEAVVVDTPAARLGLSVCFDLRFPELYRRLADGGAELLLVPSAFTRPTGEAHWAHLLRARAIETQCFVIAAAQTGEHPANRKTHGHSMVIDPWGRVMLDLGREVGVGTVALDLDTIGEVRSKLPTARNRRSFVYRQVELPNT